MSSQKSFTKYGPQAIRNLFVRNLVLQKNHFKELLTFILLNRATVLLKWLGLLEGATTLSIMAEHCYAEWVALCWILQVIPLCWVSWCLSKSDLNERPKIYSWCVKDMSNYITDMSVPNPPGLTLRRGEFEIRSDIIAHLVFHNQVLPPDVLTRVTMEQHILDTSAGKQLS